MREIKFRAFEESAKEWNNAWSTKGKGKEKPLQEWYSWEELQDYSMEVLDGDSQFTIMQYTGLKDKNGKEIYEGDRVRIRRHLVDGRDYIDFNCDIKFSTYCYCLFVADKQMWCLDPIVARECEVIGNIFSNPELLNQK